MRTVAITIQNGKKLEIFVERRKKAFEIWIVGPTRNRRLLLDHRLTHDDLEAHLEYAKRGDLIWRDAAKTEIPAGKHRSAIEMEATIKRRSYWDFDSPEVDEMEPSAREASGLPPMSASLRSVANHLVGVIALLAVEDVGQDGAKKAMIGQWTNSGLSMVLGPNHKLRWSCADPQHPLNVGERVHGYPMDWWNFAMWQLCLMNNKHKCGGSMGVLNVSKDELHIFESSHPHRIARILKRIDRQKE